MAQIQAANGKEICTNVTYKSFTVKTVLEKISKVPFKFNSKRGTIME
jgi:hypothetical protein